MELVQNPLKIVNQLAEEWRQTNAQDRALTDNDVETAVRHVLAHFDAVLSSTPGLAQTLPRLENVHFATVPNHSLVQFTCMVQDSSLASEAATVCAGSPGGWGLFCEQFDNAAQETASGNNDEKMLFLEKQPYYCVEVPGQAAWAQKEPRIGAPEGRTISPADAELMRAKCPPLARDAADGAYAAAVCKVYLDGQAQGPALGLNKVVTLVGVLEYDDGDYEKPSDPVQAALLAVDALPSPSAVPRLHVLWQAPESEGNLTEGSRDAEVREWAVNSLASILRGDRLAAEWTLVHLFGRVHGVVQGSLPVGPVPLNLYNVDTATADALGAWIASVLPLTKRLPLSLSALNETRYQPHQPIGDGASGDGASGDGLAAGVVAGELQLAPGTHLVADETAMVSGTLQAQGVANLSALQQLMRWSKVSFDFGFQTVDVPADVSVLVVSEGKSLLTVDYAVPVIPGDLQEVADDDTRKCARELLARQRAMGSVEIPAATAELIQSEFVSRRQAHAAEKAAGAASGRLMTQGDLFSLVNLARCVALSFGERELSAASWARTLALEQGLAARGGFSGKSGQGQGQGPSGNAAAEEVPER